MISNRVPRNSLPPQGQNHWNVGRAKFWRILNEMQSAFQDFQPVAIAVSVSCRLPNSGKQSHNIRNLSSLGSNRSLNVKLYSEPKSARSAPHLAPRRATPRRPRRAFGCGRTRTPTQVKRLAAQSMARQSSVSPSSHC